jgi:WD40 repeat protein
MLRIHQGHVELATLAEDAYHFVTSWKEAISTCTPHIYLSALAFTPTSSKIHQLYQPRFSGGVSVRFNIGLGAGMRHTGPITYVAFSSLGCIASASQDRAIRLWTSDGAPVGGPLLGHTRTVTCISFSEDGKHLVSGSRDRTARVWDVSTGRLIAELRGHTDVVTGVVFSSSQVVASVSKDKTIRMWNSRSAKEYTDHQELSSPLTSIALLGGHTFALCSTDGLIFHVKINFQKIRGGSSQGHGSSAPVGIARESPITCIASSPSGEWLVAGDNQGIVSQRDVAKRQDVRIMTGHQQRITAIAACTHRIASGSSDGTIRIWDINSGELLLGPLRAHSTIISLAFSPDGTKLVSASGTTSLRLWDLGPTSPTGPSISPFTDGCELKESWIRNRSDELVVWVPPQYHRSLLWPRNIANFGKTSLSLDFSKAKAWADCRMA